MASTFPGFDWVDPREHSSGVLVGDAEADTAALRWASETALARGVGVWLAGGDWVINDTIVDVDVEAGSDPFDGFAFRGSGRRITRINLDPSFRSGAPVFKLYGSAEAFVDGGLHNPEFHDFGVLDPTFDRVVKAHVIDARFCHRGLVSNVGGYHIDGSVLRYDVAYDWQVDALFTQKCGDPEGTGDAADGIASREGWGAVHEYRRCDPKRTCGNNLMSNCQILGSVGWGMVLDGVRRKALAPHRFEGPANGSGVTGHVLMSDCKEVSFVGTRFGQTGGPVQVRIIDSRGTLFSGSRWTKVCDGEVALQLEGSTDHTIVERANTVNVNGGTAFVDESSGGATNVFDAAVY